MKAIILAAGYGNRMRPLTDRSHKTLLDVGGETILSRIIDGLVENGVTDIVMVTGFAAETIRAYLAEHYPAVAFTYVHNEKYRETNNIFSLALAFDSVEIDSEVIVIESDLIYHPEIISRLIADPHPNVALVDRFRSGMDGTVVTVENSIITSVIPPHLQGERFDFSDKYKTLNIYKFSREFCQTSFRKLLSYYAHAIDDNCYYELILGILIYMQREVVYAGIVDSPWAEVDDPNDLAVAQFVFNRDRLQILENGFGGFWNYDLVDFCFIRNMYFPHSSIISEMKNNLANLIHNYGSRQVVLNTKMSWFLLCAPERVVALNGASQIYPVLRELYRDRQVLLPTPTFNEYNRIFPGAATYRDEVGIDTGALAAAMADCDCIVLVNPNNPTGSVLPTQWIHETAARNIAKVFIVDESFIEFSGQPSVISLLEERPLVNVIVVKSLSKSLGVPGIRLGYAYCCDPAFIGEVMARTPIWNMNSLAEFTLEIILKHRLTLKKSIAQTVLDREQFAANLAKIHLIKRVYPSGANFLLMRLRQGINARQVVERMLSEHSVYLKDISDKFADGGEYLRLAVRLPHENRMAVDLLESLA
ncbi:MAG: aminotransferase class I/II-fold pyridoxal phosphate-dependent enzyme [Desulfobulbaceae bacterium]